MDQTLIVAVLFRIVHTTYTDLEAGNLFEGTSRLANGFVYGYKGHGLIGSRVVWLRGVKLCMNKFALGSVGTEATQVVLAQNSSGVSVSAVGTVLAEAPVVPRAVSGLHRVRVNVEILTVLIVALPKLLKEIADGHL